MFVSLFFSKSKIYIQLKKDIKKYCFLIIMHTKYIYNYKYYVIYKITCKDPNIKEEYVGSTNNFEARQKKHVRDCSKMGTKLYKFVRSHGGFANFDFIQIDEIKCYNDDPTEARIKEREYCDMLNSTLNSNKPIMYDGEKQIYKKAYQQKDETKELVRKKKQIHNEKNKEKEKIYYQLQKEKKKIYYQLHKEELKQKREEYDTEKKTCIRAIKKAYEQKDETKELMRKNKKMHNEKNKEKAKIYYQLQKEKKNDTSKI